MLSLVKENDELKEFLSRDLHIIKAQVIWSIRQEMARTVEDFLARRTRALFLDARESRKMAPIVAELMAAELNRDNRWVERQVNEYMAVSRKYFTK